MVLCRTMSDCRLFYCIVLHCATVCCALSGVSPALYYVLALDAHDNRYTVIRYGNEREEILEILGTVVPHGKNF